MRIDHLLAALAILCVSLPAPAETPHLKPAADDALPVLSSRAEPADKTEDILLYALSLNGTRYKFGGRSADSGFDCSGFVSYVFGKTVGLDLPRTARAISQAGATVARSELQPGDLVFFNTLRRAFSHVGIYLGNNRFIHASSSNTGDVMVSDMTEKYWSKRFNGARRLAVSE